MREGAWDGLRDCCAEGAWDGERDCVADEEDVSFGTTRESVYRDVVVVGVRAGGGGGVDVKAGVGGWMGAGGRA